MVSVVTYFSRERGAPSEKAVYTGSMTWIIVGLGNPGAEYEKTRHNAGRIAVERFAKDQEMGEWKEDKKANALIVRGVVAKKAVILVLPETFMNKSGAALTKFFKSVKAGEKLIVVQDDLDLPLGKLKMCFDRGSGGHKGIESIMRAIKTRCFWRIRIGVAPTTASGKIKKPVGEDVVSDFIVASFKPKEREEILSIAKRASGAIEMSIVETPVKAMNVFN